MNGMRVFLMLALFSVCSFLAAQESSHRAEIEQFRADYALKFKNSLSKAPLTVDQLEQMDYFAPDSTYRLTARFERTPDEQPFEIPTSSGKTKPFVKYGIFKFQIAGKDYQLAVYRNLRATQMPIYRDLLFLPFQDLTNGDSTYGGGRYIDLKIGDIQYGSFVLDFNKAYNPYCAYGDGWNCPIPPIENILDVAILAGEKVFEKEEGTKK